MTTTDVARSLGVPCDTLRKWIVAGKFSQVMRLSNGHYRLDRKSVEVFVAARKANEGMTAREAARYLGVTHPTINKWIEKKILPKMERKPDGIMRFDKAVLEALAATMVVGMSTGEVACCLGETCATIEHWIKTGKLRVTGKTPGGLRRFDPKTIKAFAKKHRRNRQKINLRRNR